MRYAYLLLLIILICSQPAFGQAEWLWRVNAGVSLNQVNQPQRDHKPAKVHAIGGIPLGLGLAREWSRAWTATANYSVLIDPLNTQISRQGIEAGLAWHIMGGPLRFVQENEKAVFISNNPSQFSLRLTLATFHYSAATKDLSIAVAGAIFEVRSGLVYRLGSYGVECLITVLSYPASNERLTSQGAEASVFWYL